MQIQPEWVPIFFSFLTMIGTLILFVATRIERQNTAEQIRLYRKTQLENRLIETFGKVVNNLDEVVVRLEKLKLTKIIECQRDLSATLQQLADNLRRLSWLCGSFTDKVYQAGTDILSIVRQGAPKNETDIVQGSISKLEEELRQRLRDILSKDLSDLEG